MMKRKKHIKGYLLHISLIVCLNLNAQIKLSSLQELFDYADQNSMILKSSSLNEQLLLSKNLETKADLMPDVSTSLGYNDNITLQPNLIPAQLFDPTAPEGEFSEIVFGTKFQYSRSVKAQWDVLNFQKLFAVEVSKWEFSKAKMNTEVQRFNLYNQLASTYYSILLTKESVEIYRENIRVSEIILQNAHAQLKNGIISQREYNQALINSKQVISQLKSSLNNLQQYHVQLQSQLHTQSIIKIEDNFDVLNDTKLGELQAHPQVQLQEANLSTVEAQLKQTKALRYPSLSLVYQDTKTWATDQFFNFSDANQLPQQLFGVTLSFNPFDFSRKKKIEQSKINIEAQKLELESSKLEVEKEDELLELQLVQGMNRFEDDKQILELQKENDQHSENLYESGIISLDHRLDKYKELLNAQNNYLNSLATWTLSTYKKYIRQIDFNPRVK